MLIDTDGITLFVELQSELAGPSSLGNVHPMMTRSKHGIVKTKAFSVDVILSKLVIVAEALSIQKWNKSMPLEYDALVTKKP